MLTVDAHDQPVGGGTARGKLLSTVTTQISVYEGQANALNVVLGGVVADITLSVAPLLFWDRSTANVTVVAKDPDGYVIAGRYAAPIAVTYAGNNHAVLDPYAPTTLTDSSQIPGVVSAFGGTLAGTLTASVTNGGATITRSVPLTGSVQSTTFALSNTYDSSGTWYGAVSISTPIDRARQPMVVIPQQFYGGTSKIEGVAFDPSGNVVVANAGSMSVTVHAPGTQNTDAPVKTFALPGGSDAPTAVAADARASTCSPQAPSKCCPLRRQPPRDRLRRRHRAVGRELDRRRRHEHLRREPDQQQHRRASRCPPTGTSRPALVAGAATGLSAPRGITADGSSVWVANTGAADVRAFAKTASGNVAPARTSVERAPA